MYFHGGAEDTEPWQELQAQSIRAFNGTQLHASVPEGLLLLRTINPDCTDHGR